MCARGSSRIRSTRASQPAAWNVNKSKLAHILDLGFMCALDVVCLSEVLVPVGVAHVQLGIRHFIGNLATSQPSTWTGAAALLLVQEMWQGIHCASTDTHSVAVATTWRG